MIEIRETTLREASAYVEELHRHHGKVVGHKWSLAAYKDGRLCGVAIVGRPTGRYLDNGSTLEVTRLCTDGTRNACSALYAACARRAKREGYAKIITFILQSEPGTSLSFSRVVSRRTCSSVVMTVFSLLPWTVMGMICPSKQPPAEYKQRWAKALNQKEDTTT